MVVKVGLVGNSGLLGNRKVLIIKKIERFYFHQNGD